MTAGLVSAPAPAPAPAPAAADRLALAVRSFELEWRHGEPSVERHWARAGEGRSVPLLAALIKVDLGCRYARGQRPTVEEYLDRFPELGGHDDRVLSLIYEEFCLHEERGDRPDADQFCARYARWRDSLVSQLKYHRLLSAVVGAPATPVRFPEPGDYFEEFHLEALLGQGGAGRVYLARDESLAGRRVALKVSPDRGQEPSILARLDHEHIVPVHSVVFQTATELRGLCMPYRPGLPLDEVIRRVNPSAIPRRAEAILAVLTASHLQSDERDASVGSAWGRFPRSGTYPEAVAWIGATLARALAYAHSLGIVHRDVKPANVLLTLREGPQLLDFNLAHDPDSPDQAAAALRGGTLPYMAPEQLEAFLDPECWGQVGAAADLYSLGLVLRELLTGQAPETPDPGLPLPRAIREMLDRRCLPLVTFRLLNPTVPHALEAIVAHCLDVSPSRRYTGALALADDLERFLDGRPLRHALNPSAHERLGNWTRRNRRQIALGIVAMAALAGFSFGPIVRAVVPLERRASFRAAVHEIDADRPRAAVGLLEAMVAEEPGAPLARFYLSLTLHRCGDLDGASKQFAAMLGIADAEPILLDWERRHTLAASQLEALADALRVGQYPDLAARGFRIALRQNPRLKRSRQGTAALAEVRGEYEDAHATLSDLIREAGPRPTTDERDHLIAWCRMRARVAVRWGEQHQRVDPRHPPTAAQALYRSALDDLERSETLFEHQDRKFANPSDLVRADAWIALGTVDAWYARAAAARRNFQEARRILGQLRPLNPEEGREIDRLLKKLDATEARLLDPTATAAGDESESRPPSAH